MLVQLFVLGTLWIGIAATAWLALVPATLSVTTFSWLSGALAGAFLATGAVARNARPTRSIARVLYDVEHAPDARR